MIMICVCCSIKSFVNSRLIGAGDFALGISL